MYVAFDGLSCEIMMVMFVLVVIKAKVSWVAVPKARYKKGDV